MCTGHGREVPPRARFGRVGLVQKDGPGKEKVGRKGAGAKRAVETDEERRRRKKTIAESIAEMIAESIASDGE